MKVAIISSDNDVHVCKLA